GPWRQAGATEVVCGKGFRDQAHPSRQSACGYRRGFARHSAGGVLIPGIIQEYMCRAISKRQQQLCRPLELKGHQLDCNSIVVNKLLRSESKAWSLTQGSPSFQATWRQPVTAIVPRIHSFHFVDRVE